MSTTHLGIAVGCIAALLLMLIPGDGAAQAIGDALTLGDAVELALKANLGIKRSQEEINAADAVRHSNMTKFLPTLGTSYNVIHRNQERTQPSLLGTGRPIVTSPQDQYTFTTSFTQPIFTGFGIINEYKLSELGLDRAEVNAKLTRQDVILDAKNAYFSVLKNQKLLDVAQQTVTSIASQKEVSENFYKVGLSPLNDLLQSQVQLANAQQQLTTAQNNLEIARTRFNTVLRRPVNASVRLVDEAGYTTYEGSLDGCLVEAAKNRLEVQVADLDISPVASRPPNVSPPILPKSFKKPSPPRASASTGSAPGNPKTPARRGWPIDRWPVNPLARGPVGPFARWRM